MEESKRHHSADEELGADKIEDASRRGDDPQPAEKPSQAEGEPETVDAALKQHESDLDKLPRSSSKQTAL
jgi:hypothetical protein